MLLKVYTRIYNLSDLVQNNKYVNISKINYIKYCQQTYVHLQYESRPHKGVRYTYSWRQLLTFCSNSFDINNPLIREGMQEIEGDCKHHACSEGTK